MANKPAQKKQSAKPAEQSKASAMPQSQGKHPGGRPRIIANPEQLEQLANAYFGQCKKQDLPLTITGLALALGLSSRQALLNYENEYPEFFDAVKRAKLRVENYAETRLYGNNPTGAIFALKNFEWSDRHEHSGPDGRAMVIEIVKQWDDD